MSNLLVQANIKRKLAGRNNNESAYNYKLYVHSLKHSGNEKKYYNDLLKASLNSNNIKSPKIYDNDAAPAIISVNSVVIAACLDRLKYNVNSSIISFALLDAESIAAIREPSSEA